MRARFGADYWKLWTASVTSNFGDGVGAIAYPWLASAVTRDGFKLSLVVLATRLPWLVFSLPAGVITDRVDRKRLMVAMDITRFLITLAVAFVVVANRAGLEGGGLARNEDLVLAALLVAALLLGSAEVLRDNAAQTILPSLVGKDALEKANGRMWGAEMVMNSFAGPPAAGFLIAVSLALPFFVDAGTFAVAAVLVFTIRGELKTPRPDGPRASFRTDIREGFGWLWNHPLFRPMAIILGIVNGLMTMAFATHVLFVQEILGLEATAFGVLLTAAAVGGIIGSVGAPKVAEIIGKGPALFLTLLGGGVALLVTGVTSSAVVVWAMFLVSAFLGTVWNVITVSLRQRVIPDHLLGRVNSVYRFFGLGMMAIGAVVGGAVVSLSEPMVGREWALRMPFLIGGAVNVLAFVYALPRLNSSRIAATEATIDARV